ncbi:MAG: phenylalanine--tRNA ligase subunit beta [Candidatus Liptonbacteria bacterium]|nr:phenylalanine--tRNA ligase subunit beta [Candidatus Liptonbacteria bacterium]
MKVSYNWLQSYFEKKLPPPEELSDRFTFSLAEVEGVEKREGDTIFDINILPDRACYALSHRGIAREVGAILDIPLKEEKIPTFKEAEIPAAEIKIEEKELCTKFVGRRIENINVQKSPEWLCKRLEAIGQRAINNIVDATNYIMFDLGRPMHAFDADKVKGPLVVRSAKKGEVVVTLDNKRVKLNSGELIIADEEGPLGLAGIKGGKRAEVDINTKNIILEAANWNPTYIRRTSMSSGIRTEASKRFENRLSPLLAEEGIERVTELIEESAATPQLKIGRQVVVSFEKFSPKTIEVEAEAIGKYLGLPLITEELVEDALRRLQLPYKKEKKKLRVEVPAERLDVTIPEDIAEEVGRIVGYDKIPATLPSKVQEKLSIPRQFYWEWKIRELLIKEGFSEVMTSSFSEKGEVAIEKPLAEDKKFARPTLRSSFAKALKMNALNAPLFQADEIKIFEIGKIFMKDKEGTALAIGYIGPKKKGASELSRVRGVLENESGLSLKGEEKEGIVEFEIEAAISKLGESTNWDVEIAPAASEKYVPFSHYPFIARDVALFVPKGTDPEEILKCIQKEAGELAVKSWKFDEFEKEGKQSFAFRIIFQSLEKTLTDAEANAAMEKVYAALKKEFSAEIR